MKTSSQIAQEYIDEYPKVERNKDECLFDYYVGNNGKEIKGKNRKSLKYLMELNYLDTLFVDSAQKEFWDKLTSSTNRNIYMWGSSVLFDFNDNFYYELRNIEQAIIDNPTINSGKIKIAKINMQLQSVEDVFETDIIVL
jgi:hypothetical protein